LYFVGFELSVKLDHTNFIDGYIHYYNTRRVQRNLGILTPWRNTSFASPPNKNRKFGLPAPADYPNLRLPQRGIPAAL
jgi:hypothetical protein